MIFEPLAGKRETVVTGTRKTIDFADILRYTADVLYPSVEKMVLVTDNLNTHAVASLYKAFPLGEACRLAQRFEWHHIPVHGSRMGVAEDRVGIMNRQVFARSSTDVGNLKKRIRVWTTKRNTG